MAPRRPTEAAERIAKLRDAWVRAVQDAAAPGASRAERRRALNRRRYLERELRGAERAERRGEPLPTAREAAGHYRAGANRWALRVYVADPPRTFVAELDLRDARRAGRYLAAVEALATHRRFGGLLMTPERFRTTVRRWRPLTVRGPAEEAGRRQFLADPDAALVLLEGLRVAGEDLVAYRPPGGAR
jgi:hypothetical protein